MRQKQPYHVIGFRTTDEALIFERYCTANQIPGRIIPLPEAIAAGCGFAYRMPEAEWERFGKQLKEALSYETDLSLMMY